MFRIPLGFLFTISVAAIAAACSGATTNVLDRPDGGNAGLPGKADDGGNLPGKTNPNTGPSGTPPIAIPVADCGNQPVGSVAGTWDLTSTGTDVPAVLTVGPHELVIDAGNRKLSYSASGGNMTITWETNGDVADISAEHNTIDETPPSFGIIPLDFAGQWAFSGVSGGPDTASLTMSAAGFTASASKLHTTLDVGRLDGTAIGSRTATRTSVFGELGGVWHVKATGGGTSTLDITIENNSFTVAGHDGASRFGTVTIKVCDGRLSGATSEGFELAGTRR